MYGENSYGTILKLGGLKPISPPATTTKSFCHLHWYQNVQVKYTGTPKFYLNSCLHKLALQEMIMADYLNYQDTHVWRKFLWKDTKISGG